MKYVAAAHRGTLDTLKAYNYDWPWVYSYRGIDGPTGIVLKIDHHDDVFRAQYQADRYASGMIPAMVFETQAEAQGWLDTIVLTMSPPAKPNVDYLAAPEDLRRLIEASEAMYEEAHKLKGIDTILCQCDVDKLCAWHAWMDELDGVQGKRPRREGL